MNRFLRVCYFAVTLASLLFEFGVQAAEYPTKTVQIVNPFPPGAVTDIIARLITDKVPAALGQPVVVVNKTGGGGAVGIKAVKDAPADGYTILIAPPPVALIPLARKGIGLGLRRFHAAEFSWPYTRGDDRKSGLAVENR